MIRSDIQNLLTERIGGCCLGLPAYGRVPNDGRPVSGGSRR
jgi:hypothetical protein